MSTLEQNVLDDYEIYYGQELISSLQTKTSDPNIRDNLRNL